MTFVTAGAMTDVPISPIFCGGADVTKQKMTTEMAFGHGGIHHGERGRRQT